MKNILLVSHQSDLSGAPISLYLLAKELDKKQFNVFYLTPTLGPIISKLNESKIKTIILDNKELSKNRFIRKIKRLTYSAKIFKIIKEKKIDLIHVNTILANFGAQAGYKAKIPVIWHLRETLQNPRFNLISKKKINQISNKVIVASQAIKDIISQFVSKEKIEIVYNGVDLNQFDSNLESKIKEEFKILPETKLIGIIGSLEENKGVDFFIQAAAKIKQEIPKIKFLIVGKTLPNQKKYLDFLKNLTKKLGIENDIIFSGARTDITQIIKALDVVVISSKFEAFGRTIIEGMAMEKPVIASNCGGIPEIIEDGKSGILFPVGDIDSLATNVVKILQDKNLALKLGKEGKKRVEEKFSIKKCTQKIENIYEEILNKKIYEKK